MNLSPFCKLADASTYVSCDWNLVLDDAGRIHWVDFFNRHLNTILNLGIVARTESGESVASVEHAADGCRTEFYAYFDQFAAEPAKFCKALGNEPITILTLDQWRDGFLRKHGFVDSFSRLKDRENETALPLLHTVCEQLDQLGGDIQLQAIIEGVFAGNIFDMGAEATAKAFLHGGPDFFETRKKIARRPWLIDHYDALSNRLLDGPVHRKAVFFIDNAGSDFLLGAIPMMRWLGRRGTTVILAANENPTLNDMTIHDVNRWWPRIVQAEPSLADLPIERVSTGTSEPLIDLLKVSDALNAAAQDADLVILEGMGRGVESNLNVRFECDGINLAMLKDIAVANRCNGKIYDVVCRYAAGI